MTSNTTWRKSSYTGNDNNCVELLLRPDTSGIRDSKNPTGPRLRFDRADWTTFLTGVKDAPAHR